MSEGFLDSELQDVSNQDTVIGILTKFGEETAKKLKESLAHSGHQGGSASDIGTLEQSIRWDIKPKGNGVWQFKLNIGQDNNGQPNYADFINEGVQGVADRKRATDSKFRGSKGQPFKNKAPNSPFTFKKNKPLHGKMFEGWARRKGISEWAAAFAVWQTGIRPNKFIDKVITPEIITDLTKGIESAGAKQLEGFIVNKLLEALD